MTITPGTNSEILSSYTFTSLPSFDIDYEMKAKIFNQEGDIKYEYNPFRNLRDTSSGELKDFTTTALNFDLNHPVEIEVQPSYDGSVNLILNDDKNPPRMINSRFTVIEDRRYEIIDRKGNNDTNIYSETELNQDIRLFKTSGKIPYVDFQGLIEGGALKSGNYVFYFKYSDADGNESDIVAESGIVSCYIGKVNDPFSTKGGIANELTNKVAKLKLSNLDTAYDYVNIYFTRSTSDYAETELTEAYQIVNRKPIKGDSVNITITGLEEVRTVSIDLLNQQFNVVDSVKSETQVQNMLFFGNVDKPTIPYKELEDLSLRIYPTVSNDNNIGYLDENYKAKELSDELTKHEYYDAVNVYKYVGYWNKEIYRLGVVYIMKDDTLSPVFNVRGRDAMGKITRLGTFENDIAAYYTHKPVWDGDKRVYVGYDDEGFIPESPYALENVKGVLRIMYDDPMLNKNGAGVYPLAVNFNIVPDVMTELQKHVKGFFFVRQKRVPTLLCQGLSIGVDSVSFLPMLKAEAVGSDGQKSTGYIAEGFMDKSNMLVHDITPRLIVTQSPNVSTGGMIVPEAMLKSEQFNQIFTSSLFSLSRAPFKPTDRFFTQSKENNRHFYVKGYSNQQANDVLYTNIKLTSIDDDKPLRYSGTKQFSTRAGIPEEAWKYSFLTSEDRSKSASNLIRGSFMGFVGAEGLSSDTDLYDIHVPGYDVGNMRDYFLLRMNSFHPFYTISDRYDMSLLKGTVPKYSTVIKNADHTRFEQYRGDCFINNFTVRVHRNFGDPETPTNDIILDSMTWKNNYNGFESSGSLDKEKVGKINRGDLNAVRIGHWATFKICSNINLAYRSVNESISAEYALTGKPRAFYPLSSMSTRGESKVAESTVINVGYSSTTSDKVYTLAPDVPYIKNIFDNRIMFSQIHITDAFRNGYRIFDASAYKDITKQYGAITKILEWNNELMVIFENGIAMIPINEKMVGAQSEGGAAFIKSFGVLPDIVNPISTDFGSTWKDSIIRTRGWVYGVDTFAKKIWRTDGRSMEVISDFKMQKFLNENITLNENERFAMVALRNVKTHFNAFKNDVMFTFYDTTRSNEENVWNICYNEQIEKWVTRYDWTPLVSGNINNVYFSFDRDSAKSLALVGYSNKNNPVSEGIVLDNVFINNLSAATNVGKFSLKGYDYYNKYTQVFTLDPSLDASNFTITNSAGQYTLRSSGSLPTGKYVYNLKVRVGLSLASSEVQHFYDYISVIVDRTILNSTQKTDYDTSISTWFWKHGQAGIFDVTTPVKVTEWYGEVRPFEFEFVIVDNPSAHKVFDNLMLISNNAEPDSFEFEVVGDVYDFPDPNYSYADVAGNYTTEIDPEHVKTYQKGLNMKTLGRSRGNMHYKEDMWNVEIKPVRFMEGSKLKETRLRDKHCKIRVRYSGEKLAVITALQTLYTLSYA